MVRHASSLILAVALVHVARADAPAASEREMAYGQRSVGIGAEIGFNTGIGLSLHLGTPKLGLYLAAGLVPILVFGNEQGSTRSLTLDVYHAFALNADLYAMLAKPQQRTEFGVAGGYSGDTVLGNGANLGFLVRYQLRNKLALTLFGGLAYFPDARSHLMEHGYPATRDASIPQLRTGVNFGLVFYP